MMNDRPDIALLAHYEQRLHEFGDTARGADWPSEQDRRVRFDMMLDVIPDWRRRMCASSSPVPHPKSQRTRSRRRGLDHVRYIGVDRSEHAIGIARSKFPEAEFIALDVNGPEADLDRLACDYLVASGLFTVKASLTDAQMWEFLDATLAAVWPHVRRGVAFNVMSTAVDWRRDDLFHASADDLLQRLHALAGRRVRLRADYGLFEYTAYALKPAVEDGNESGADTAALPVAPPAMPAVPVMRPRLPTADRLLPYLRRIDDARTYSNFGPLASELEQRLAGLFGLAPGTVTTASSGMAAIVGAILGGHGRASTRPLALLPAYTFVATAVAVEQCGYQPVLADIDPETWQLTPDAVAAHPGIERIGLVVPVAPLGRPVDQAPWRAFRERTGIPVVIDGAAAFEALSDDPARYLGDIPVALSFHATKSFGVGEGGAVAGADPDMAVNIARALNFGFHAARDSRSPSTNGKMSEYHAAVGLAELDGWNEKRRLMRSVAARYRAAFAAGGLESRLRVAPTIGSSYAVFVADHAAQAGAVCRALSAGGIDFRLWYGLGLHRQTYFSGLPHAGLAVTDDLAPRLIGLPVAPDLTDAVMARVADAVARGVAAA